MNFQRQSQSWPVSMGYGLLLLVLVLGGCRTRPPFPAADLRQPGWVQKQYQVVWQADPQANEMVCDVIQARHSSGQTFLEVSKAPLVLATVQAEGDKWWIGYGPRPRSAKGESLPKDATHLWVLIALQKREAAQLKIETLPNGNQRWINLKTGERIEGVPAS